MEVVRDAGHPFAPTVTTPGNERTLTPFSSIWVRAFGCPMRREPGLPSPIPVGALTQVDEDR